MDSKLIFGSWKKWDDLLLNLERVGMLDMSRDCGTMKVQAMHIGSMKISSSFQKNVVENSQEHSL